MARGIFRPGPQGHNAHASGHPGHTRQVSPSDGELPTPPQHRPSITFSDESTAGPFSSWPYVHGFDAAVDSTTLLDYSAAPEHTPGPHLMAFMAPDNPTPAAEGTLDPKTLEAWLDYRQTL